MATATHSSSGLPPMTAFLFALFAPFALLNARDGLNALAMFVFYVLFVGRRARA